MNIILITETLVTGGAETFTLRLANALHLRGEEVTLYVLRPDKVDTVLIQSIAPNVKFRVVDIPYLTIFSKIDGLLFRLGFGFSLLRWLQIKQLGCYLFTVKPDVVHSHLFTSDLVTATATKALNIPWVTTMHGDYATFELKGNSQAARIKGFLQSLRHIEKSVSHMVCITDSQIDQLIRLLPTLAEKKGITKIYNGYAVTSNLQIKGVVPEIIAHIPADGFVIGMVSRGIRDKGWEVLISSFLELNLPNSWLVLVGDGDYLKEVRPSIHDNRIIFTGNVPDPLRYISRFDIGCLPSMFTAESLPTVVIEYLYLGKPVIASNVGELSNMLDTEGKVPAGVLIELGEVKDMINDMKSALQKISNDKIFREQLQINTQNALKKFDMDRCVDAYMTVYRLAK